MNWIIIQFLHVIFLILPYIQYTLIAYSIIGWLILFNIVNPRNQFIYIINSFLGSIIEPLVRPIRAKLPVAGGLDISYLVLYLSIYILKYLIIICINRLTV